MSWIVSVFIVAPILCAGISYLFNRSLKIQLIVSLLINAAQLALASFIVTSLSGGTGLSFVFGGWPEGIGIKFVADQLSALLVGVSALIFLAGCVIYYIEQTRRRSKQFYGFVLLAFLQLGVNGSFLTSDLFNLFVFFEVLLISALVLLSSQRGLKARSSAVFYLGMNFFASAVFLLAIGIIYQKTGTLSFDTLGIRFSQVDSHWQLISAALLLVCFLTKAGLFPLFFWLPKAYPQLSGALGGVFGGLLTKVGLYCILRLFFVLFPQGSLAFWVVFLSGMASMLLGVFAAFSQKEIRAILSFHIISQVGYIASGIGLAGLVESDELRMTILTAVIFYLIHHILVKSNLFFASSWINFYKKSTKLDDLEGVRTSFPLLSLMFVVPALSLAGLPPFSGFWAKLSIIRAGFIAESYAFVFIALLAGLFTFLSMLKIWQLCFAGTGPKDTEVKSKDLLRLNLYRFSIASVLFMTLAISFYPSGLFRVSGEAAKNVAVLEFEEKGLKK